MELNWKNSDEDTDENIFPDDEEDEDLKDDDENDENSDDSWT